MSNQLFLGAIIGPFYLVLGLSVLFYSDAWKKIGSTWQKDHIGLLSMMIFNLIFGLVIINMYNVWQFSPFLIVTLTGWMAFLKGVAYFLLPGNTLKTAIKTFNKKDWYKGTGVVITLLGALLSYFVYLT